MKLPEMPGDEEFKALSPEEQKAWYRAILIANDEELPDDWDTLNKEEVQLWVGAFMEDAKRHQLAVRQAMEDFFQRKDEIEQFMEKNPTIDDPIMALCCLKAIDRGELAAWDLAHYYPEEGRE